MIADMEAEMNRKWTGNESGHEPEMKAEMESGISRFWALGQIFEGTCKADTLGGLHNADASKDKRE